MLENHEERGRGHRVMWYNQSNKRSCIEDYCSCNLKNSKIHGKAKAYLKKRNTKAVTLCTLFQGFVKSMLFF